MFMMLSLVVDKMVENEIEDNGKEVAKNSLSQESKKR
jgi:hypothetical protein